MAQTYSFEILAEVKKARQSVDNFAKETQRQLDSINLGSAVTGINAAFSLFDRAVGFVQPFIDAVVEAEEANAKLANSLRITGQISNEALKDLTDYADQLARVSKATDDQIKSSLAYAKSLGLTNAETKKVIQAASELSAITGDSLESSVDKLAKTLNGSLSKELKLLLPELAQLSKEQLIAGEALDKLTQKFGGSAAAEVNTLGGAFNQLGKGLGEVVESIGGLATKNEEIKETTQNVAGLAFAFSDLINKISAFDLRASNKKAIDLFNSNQSVNSEEQLKEFKNLQRKQIAEAKRQSVADEEIKKNRLLNLEKAKSEEAFSAIRSKIELAGLSDIEKINKEHFETVATLRKAQSFGQIPAEINLNKTLIGLANDREKRISFIIDKETQERERKRQEEERKRIEADRARREQISAVSRLEFNEIFNVSLKQDKEALAAFSAGIANAALDGAEGARRAISSAFGAIADKLLPGVGGVVGDIVSKLSQGPEKTKQMVEEFARAIPQIISNLVQALPVLIETLARELPPALAKTMPQVAFAFSTELIKNIPNIIKGFAEGLVEAAENFVNALFEAIPGGQAITGGNTLDLSNTGSTIGDIFSGIGDFFGFAEGGLVPDQPKFEGDKFPARLNAGELVIDRELTQKLDRFIDGGGSAQQLVVNLVVGEAQLAQAILNLNRRGFRTA